MSKDKRDGFPAGSRLLARITPLERERNIFIVGHRLEPYRAMDTPPWGVKLSTESGEALSSRLIPISLDAAAIFFTFFGMEELFSLLVDQDSDNAKTLTSAGSAFKDAIIRVKAFDLGSLYASGSLAAGDYLEFELADRSGTRFTVRPLKAADIPPERKAAWFRGLDRGREAAMRTLERPVSPTDFIAALFAGAPRLVREEPAAALSEYYNDSGTLQIKVFGGRSFMWTSGVDIPTLLFPDGHPEDADDDDDEDDLSRSLAALGFALNSAEIDAFVRDALWRGQGVEEALDRCFTGAGELGLPRKKLDALMGEVRAFAQGVAAGWDRSAENPEIVRIRSALLDMYAAFLNWMRRIGGLITSPSDLDTEDFSLLSEAMQNICLFIVAFGSGEAPDSNEGIDEISQQLTPLAEMTDSLMESIEEGLGGTVRRGRRSTSSSARKPSAAGGGKGKRTKRPAAQKQYTFEMKLADIEPAIRRQIVVPGNRTLAELHTIIQDAFGWTDSHLHLFRFRGEAFGLPSPEDFEPLIDERKVRLDDLSLRGRSKLDYVYDFGDAWEHELLVLLTRKIAPDDDSGPFCLEAERAAPPEDCGGLPGYLGLLEALAKAEKDRDEEESEIVDWVGEDWDPESCDIKAINQALAKD